MKWRVSKKCRSTKPDDEHYVWFAWYPVICWDDQIRWLERVLVHRSYYWGWYSQCWRSMTIIDEIKNPDTLK